jgi:hypothetical protein
MDYNEKVHLCNMVEVACSMQDMELLKQLLPTPEKLVEYRDMQNGGSLLHTLMYANGDNPVEFLNSIITEYNLDNNPALKKELFLKRNANDKYAADFSYIYKYLHPKIQNQFEQYCGKKTSASNDFSDNRIEAEKNKVKLYLQLKDQIKSLNNENAKEVAFGIPKAFHDASDNHFDSFPVGTPVSNPLYLPDKDGKPALYIRGSIQEEYPEIRLLNYENKENNIEEGVCILRGMKINSEESLLSQAIRKMDFPEDFVFHFQSLRVFEDDYKRLRENEGKNATNRYFNKHRGAIVFETEQQKGLKGNSNCSGYLGYITSFITLENDKSVNYPIIVMPSIETIYQNNNDTFDHELFHGIDLRGHTHFSEMPIFKYAMMLEECNPKGKFRNLFNHVNNLYDIESYNSEMAAYILQHPNKEALKETPLLSKVYELGECFAIAKANDDKGALSRIATAMDRSPHNTNLKAKHLRFMAGKQNGTKFEMDETKRQSFENHIIKHIDKTIEIIRSNQQNKTINNGYER